MATAKRPAHKWDFQRHLHARSIGWKSSVAISRLGDAAREIDLAALHDPVLAAEGAILLLERVSPAFAQVDSSSGAIGSAVNLAIAHLVQLIADAPVDRKTREKWLTRLYEAHAADKMTYIESLADFWGELCATKELASAQADRLLGATRLALRPDKTSRRSFRGTAMCCSALLYAERYDELMELLSGDCSWHDKQFAARALVAQGKIDEAIAYAEACRTPSDWGISRFCEETLLAAGRTDEAYRRYALDTDAANTSLATLRALAERYHKQPADVLRDLVRSTPGEEGQWFDAARSLKLYPEALDLASRSPCEPRTLTRAARDFLVKQPEFALGCGLLALRWLAAGHGYKPTSADVRAAWRHTTAVAERLGRVDATREQLRALLAQHPTSAAARILAQELALPTPPSSAS